MAWTEILVLTNRLRVTGADRRVAGDHTAVERAAQLVIAFSRSLQMAERTLLPTAFRKTHDGHAAIRELDVLTGTHSPSSLAGVSWLLLRWRRGIAYSPVVFYKHLFKYLVRFLVCLCVESVFHRQ